jgi:hypothetical protein
MRIRDPGLESADGFQKSVEDLVADFSWKSEVDLTAHVFHCAGHALESEYGRTG